MVEWSTSHDERLEWINSIVDERVQWKWTKARKSHRDEHGVEIKKGEYYFSKARHVGSFSSYRLAERSMIIHLETFSCCSSEFISYCDSVMRKRKAKVDNLILALDFGEDA